MNSAFVLIAIASISFCTLQDNSCRGSSKNSNVAESKPTASPLTVDAMSPESGEPRPSTTSAASGAQKLSGLWGGVHVRLEISEEGSTFEFDCATGSTSEPISLDSAGHFDVSGTYTRQGPGPVREGGQRDARARYSGNVTGETMKLKVQLEGSSEAVFDLSLTRGKAGKITKCY